MTGNADHCQDLHSEVFETNGLRGQSIDEIAQQIRWTDASLIALDGLPGSGKTTFAASLSALLTIRAVHLDAYLGRDYIGFTDSLRYGDLQRALLQRPVIVEGVCMLDVLDRLALRPDQSLYLQAPLAERSLDRSHPLVREVRAYTNRSRPVECANIVLTRSESVAKKQKTLTAWQSILDACLMRNRSQISLGLAAAGMIMLATGAVLVITGSSAHGETMTRVDGRDYSLIGAGLLTMLMSGIWIFLARSALTRARVDGSPKSKK